MTDRQFAMPDLPFQTAYYITMTDRQFATPDLTFPLYTRLLRTSTGNKVRASERNVLNNSLENELTNC